jgi:hypothetical protein
MKNESYQIFANIDSPNLAYFTSNSWSKMIGENFSYQIILIKSNKKL